MTSTLDPDPSATEPVTRGCAQAECSGPERRRIKVLVTGFNDWRGLNAAPGSPPNLWRCRDNPSCRLLVGAPCDLPPLHRDGPLPRLLRATESGTVDVEYTFQTCALDPAPPRRRSPHTPPPRLPAGRAADPDVAC